MAAHLATQEVIWTRRLLADLGFPQALPTPLFSDNQAAIRLVWNPEFHRRTKHIDIKFHMIREAQVNGQNATQYVPTADQIADMFTKPLTKEKFARMRGLIELTGQAPPDAGVEA